MVKHDILNYHGNKKHIFIIYDQVAKLEGSKHVRKDKLYSTLQAHAEEVTVVSSKTFLDLKAHLIYILIFILCKRFLNDSNTEIHPIIYNGNELGVDCFMT